MGDTLEALERKRKELYRRLATVGDFRRGTVGAGSRKCGKENCACAQPSHPGHSRYLWSTTTRGNRSLAKTLRLGPDLEKASREVANYREFMRLVQEIVELNEKICDLRPAMAIEDVGDLEALKKKQLRMFAAKRRKS